MALDREHRIVHMVEAFDSIGGPPKLVRQIVRCLGEKYEFRVLSYSIAGLRPGSILQLSRELRRLCPDIVHIHGLKVDGFHAVLAAKLARIPRILVTIHGSTADAISQYRTPLRRLQRWTVGYLLEPITLRLGDAVYCVCDAMKSKPRIRRHAGSRLRRTIHNSIEVGEIVGRQSCVRESFGLSADDLVLIYTGRISKDKGLEVLADALVAVLQAAGNGERGRPPSGHAVKLLLVGDGTEFAAVRSRFLPLIRSGDVIMTGGRKDVGVLLANSDIFILPSFHENLSFALLEAMSAGLPVIATAVGGNPEVVVDGLSGLLVAPSDACALAHSIAQLCADASLRLQMGLAGRERVRNEFSVASMVRKTDEVYQSLLAPGD